MNRKEDILNKLFSMHRFGIKPGLERTYKLLEYSGNPHLKFPSIHVAGTNGKGSICSMLASILMEAGFKVGLYTSPHLVRFNERITINGIEITDDEMVDLAEKLLSVSEKFESTFFEVTTVMAFEYFAKNKVDIAIIETGMGGRFDSTNVLTPLVSIISSIGVDHKEYLGNTFEKIAFEKAGIIKASTPVVITDNNKRIKHVFADKAQELNSEIVFSTEQSTSEIISFNPDFSQNLNINSGTNNYCDLKLSLPGKHQIQNLSGVLIALEKIREQFPFTKENIYHGLANIKKNTGIGGRIEVYDNREPTTVNGQQITANQQQITILDTGHNPSSMKRLVETLKLHRPDIDKWNFIYGAMEDKDVRKVLETIYPVCDELFLTQPKIDRAMKLDKLADKAIKAGFERILCHEYSPNAVFYANIRNKPTVITGSFYLAGEVLPVIEKLFKE